MAKKAKSLTATFLKSKGVPAVLIAGLIFAASQGDWNWSKYFSKMPNYYNAISIFPDKARITAVTDGDTTISDTGLSIRLVGIDAPNRGAGGYNDAINFMLYLVSSKEATLEYDAYQDDKYGRILAYVWVPCIQELAKYCRSEHNNELLVNEVMVKENKAQHVIYSKRKRLRYESYFSLD